MASDFQNGIIQLGLIEGLRSILDQYPNDNQILKELIQNAEDAGASEVKFVYDTECYSREKVHPGLEASQGPALLAYNNAIFTDTDWKSVRMLQNSLKIEDLTKVGRFGLGFKSVFHITDLPGILSGHQLGFLDPHERFFEVQKGNRTKPTSSYAWNLKDASARIPDQIKPFCQTMLGNIKDHYFPGTLLRFPLRCNDHDSEISNTVYDESKIRYLFEALQQEAHSFLLFLTNIERIEVYEKIATSSETKLLFAISIEKSVLNHVREARKCVKDAISGCTVKNPWPENKVSKSFELQTCLDSYGKTEVKRWILTHYVDDGSDQDFRELSMKGCSKMLAWVGIAHPIINTIEEPRGQIFAFLPLPFEEESATGVHFHVHGYFAVEQNRRHLKWSSYQGQHTDYEREWNAKLLSICLPKAMKETLLYCISQDFSAEDIYRLFPQAQTIKAQWKTMMEAFYIEIQEVTFIRSINKGWVSVDDACYIEGNNPHREIIKIVFLKTNHECHLADLPNYIYESLPVKPRKVTPIMMKQLLHDYRTEQFSRDERCKLLNYFHSMEATAMLRDLQLCEFEDGLKTFSNECYIVEPQIRKLCPGLQCRFHVTADKEYEPLLVEIAYSGKTELHVKGLEDVPTLLRIMLQDSSTICLNHCHQFGNHTYLPSTEWVQCVWGYIEQYPKQLHALEGLPVLLAKDMLYPLSKKLPLLKINDCHDICSVLDKLGFILVENAIVEHMNEFVKPINPDSVLEQLHKINDAINKVSGLCKIDRLLLRDILSDVKKEGADISMLKRLPLFDCFPNASHVTSAENVSVGYDKEPFIALVGNAPVIDLSGYDSHQLCKLLDIRVLSESELIQRYILPYFCDYCEEEKNKIINKALELVDNDTIQIFLRKTACIPTMFHGRKLPCDLIDPRNTTVAQLFRDTEILSLPHMSFHDAISLERLKKLGMREEDGITAQHIYELACYLDSKSNENSDDCDMRGEKFADFLNSKKKPILDQNVTALDDITLREALRSKACLPYLKQRPRNYDDSLPWFESDKCLFAPESLTIHFTLTGSNKATADERYQNLVKHFEWHIEPPLEQVIEHLLNIINNYDTYCDLSSCLLKIYEYLSAHKVKNIAAKLESISWIWHGNGFASCAEMVLENDIGVNLTPYIHTCPQIIKPYANLFRELGVERYVDGIKLLKMIKKHQDDNTKTHKDENERQRCYKRDLDLTVKIITHLVEQLQLSNSPLPLDILIPLETKSIEHLVLLPVSECTYCDSEWILKDANIPSDMGKDFNIVHSLIPAKIIRDLGIPSYKSRFLNAENLKIECFGQTESVTSRMHSILEDYKDGSAVLKELIQNADDAGATEVAFIYDTRDLTLQSQSLLDVSMKSLQGPALWAYNNATFTDDDFKNIVKLSGATKKKDKTMIGRFGIGFNAVYHLTDVPMFVSRESIVVFDPQTTYLGSALRDKSNPGIRLNINNNARQIDTFKDQFKPFENIFGFDIKKAYDGTLFRLPLRTAEQAKNSQISNKIYNENEVLELFRIVEEQADTMLLFTQNVAKLSVYKLGSDAMKPNPHFSIQRRTLKVLRPFGVSKISNPEDENKVLHVAQERSGQKGAYNCLLQEVVVGRSPDESDDSPKTRTYWAKSGAFDLSTDGSTSVGGVACKVVRDATTFRPIPLESGQGLMFCFLPLPIASNIPVHLNGYFELTSSRTELHWRNDTDKLDNRCKWNEIVFQGPLCSAYIGLLQEIVRSDDFDKTFLKENIFKLFPMTEHKLKEGSTDPIFVLTKEFLKGLCCNLQISLFPSENKWCNGSSFHALAPSLVAETFQSTCKMLSERLKLNFVTLPSAFHKCIDLCDLHECVEKQMISLESFYKTIFIPHIQDIDRDTAKALLRFALDQDSLHSIIKNNNCIEVVSSSGRILKKPSELIDPTCDLLKNLYNKDEEVFPVYITEAPDRKDDIEISFWRNALARLGMKQSMISNNEILEKAKNIRELNYESAVKRSHALVRLLGTLDNDEKLLLEMKPVLLNTEILVKREKPSDWTWPWAGDKHNTYLKLESYVDTLEAEHIGCVIPQVNIQQEHISSLHNLLKIFDLNYDITEQHVWQYLKLSAMVLEKTNKTHISKFALSIQQSYTWLEENDVSFLKNENTHHPVIYLPDKLQMVPPEKCVIDCAYDCTPVIYTLPRGFEILYTELTNVFEIKQTPCPNALRKYLSELAERNAGSLDIDERTVVINVIKCLSDLQKSSDDCSVHLNTFLVNDNWVMRRCSDLCFHVKEGSTDVERSTRLNAKISPSEARKLGVRTFEQKRLDDYSVTGVDFGQREELTNRIKRLLDAYAFDHEILKEMVQNADDAKATEICFILDERMHDGTKIIVDPESTRSWKPLQGPSLLIYNNKPFTKNDINGIQKLGQGSKGDDPTTTGKYGVGFNCVYHITDTPTFYSKGSEIGEVLCAFDPQCKFIPGASAEKPGRMFNVGESFRQDYFDVIKAYDMPFETGDEYTVFRLPLRMETMESTLCSKAVNVEDITKLLKTFEKELHKILLFLPHVSKISTGCIKQNCSYQQFANVYAEVTEVHQSRKHNFYRAVHDAQHILLEQSIQCMPKTTECFEIEIHTSTLKERWLIVQCLGLFHSTEHDEFLYREHKLHKSILLPKGGVAFKLWTKEVHAHRGKEKCGFKGGLFCGLPLPKSSYLPMHVNGDFILDSENRHEIYESNADSFKSIWNKVLIQSTISRAYSEAVRFLKQQVKTNRTCYENIETSLKTYIRALPCIIGKQQAIIIHHLPKYIYANLKDEAFIPVIMRTVYESEERDFKLSDQIDLTWMKIYDQVYFDSPLYMLNTAVPYSKALRNVLLNFRFPFAFLPMEFCHVLSEAFRCDKDPDQTPKNTESQIPKYVDPKAVATYLQNYKNVVSMQLPCAITLSPFLKDTALKETLDYVMKNLFIVNRDKRIGEIKVYPPMSYPIDKQLSELARNDIYSNLREIGKGLPLLLSKDELLHELGFHDVYASYYSVLFPKIPDRFLNPLFTDHPYKCREYFEILRPFIKHMGIAELESLLPEQLPKDMYYDKERVQVKEQSAEQSDSKWFETLYEFIELEVHRPESTGGMGARKWHLHEIDILKPWCIVPVKHNSEIYLTALSNIWKLCDQCRFPNLPLPQLYSKWYKCYQVLKQLCPNDSKPYEFLQALENYFSKEGCIDKNTSNSVLLYFSENLKELSSHEDSRRLLQNLPFYQTTQNTLQSLFGEVVVIPDDAIKSGLSKISNVVFLDNNLWLSALYKYLHCTCLDFEQFYGQYVLENIPVFTEKELVLHMSTIKHYIERGRGNSLLPILKRTRFLITERGYATVDQYYDPSNELFSVMNEPFPPCPFNQSEWLPFLERIGLISEVTIDMCKRYATKIPEDTNLARQRAECLIKYIHHNHGLDWLKAIKSVPFIPVQEVSNGLQDLAHVKYNCEFTSYAASCSLEYINIIWTIKPLLHEWACPVRVMELVPKPTPLEVLEHLEILINKWNSELKKQPRKIILHLQSISCECYGYVKDLEIPDINRVKQLQGVISDDGNFYSVSQVVRDLKEWSELTLYVVNLPGIYYAQLAFLKTIGLSETLTVCQACNVLSLIYADTNGKDMDPNQVINAFIATKAVAALLLKSSDAEVAEIRQLYLLTKHTTLECSENIVIVDKCGLDKRAGELEKPLLCDLDLGTYSTPILSIFNIQDAIQKLPNRLRPILLSKLVVEKLKPSCRDYVLDSGSPHFLEQRLNSEEFQVCILRILRHKSPKTFTDQQVSDMLDNISQCLSTLIVIELEHVITVLTRNGEDIKDSEAASSHFIERTDQSVQVYVCSNDREIGPRLASELAAVLSTLLEMSNEHQSYVESILREKDMSYYLDEKDIQPVDGTQLKSDIPEVGEFVDQKYICMLEQAIWSLQEQEYVAFEIDDPLLNDDTEDSENTYDATYIYVQVLKRILPDDDASPINYKYQVDMGERGRKTVCAWDLYRFQRREKTENTVALSDHTASDFEATADKFNQESPKRSLRETYQYITQQLREAMELYTKDNREWRKIVKRLFLEIHPDKNLEEVELYTEAFKFLQMQVVRVENGKNLFESDETKGYTSGSGNSWFERHTSAFSQRTSRHRQQRQSFSGYQHNRRRRNRRRRGHHSGRQSDNESDNPQPGLASRWIRQANLDLAAVTRDQGSPQFDDIPHEWACFKAFQAAKKACMAAQYAVDASEKQPQHSVLSACKCTDHFNELKRMVGGDEGEWTQYPDPESHLGIPRQRFTKHDSDKAKQLATQIVTNCKKFIERKH